MKSQVLSVEGMSCGHCVETIEKSLGQMTGVNHVQVNLDAKSVTIQFDETQVRLQALKDAIQEAGFDVKD